MRVANGFQTKKKAVEDFLAAVFSLRTVHAEDRDFLLQLNESVMRPHYESSGVWDSGRAQEFMRQALQPGKDQIIVVDGERAGLLAVDRLDDLRFAGVIRFWRGGEISKLK